MFGHEKLFPFARPAGAEGGRLTRIDGRLERVKNHVARSCQRNAGEKVINDSIQRRGAIVDQIFKMNLHHFRMIQPAEIRRKALRDIWKFNVQLRSAQNTYFEPLVEVREGLIIIMMDMLCFHVGHIKNVRYSHIARVAEDKVWNEARLDNAVHRFRSREKMRRGNIARTERIQPINRFLRRALASAFAFVLRVERMQSPRKRRDLRKAKQNLIEQMRAA